MPDFPINLGYFFNAIFSFLFRLLRVSIKIVWSVFFYLITEIQLCQYLKGNSIQSVAYELTGLYVYSGTKRKSKEHESSRPKKWTKSLTKQPGYPILSFERPQHEKQWEQPPNHCSIQSYVTFRFSFSVVWYRYLLVTQFWQKYSVPSRNFLVCSVTITCLSHHFGHSNYSICVFVLIYGIVEVAFWKTKVWWIRANRSLFTAVLFFLKS